MPLARRIAMNVVLNSLAKVCATVLALAAIGVLTRYLGQDGFGHYATMLAFFAFFNAIGDLGLATVTARELGRPGADEGRIMSRVLSLRFLSSLVIFSVIPVFVWALPYPGEVRAAIIISGAAFVFASGSMVLNGLFQKHLMMYRVSAIELVGKTVQLGVIAAAAYWDLGFLVVACSLLAYMAFNISAVLLVARRFGPLTLSFDPAFWRQFLQESLPVGGAAVITFAYFKMDTILLSIFSTPAAVGIYNLAYKIIENLTFFPAMVVGLVLPVLSRYIGSERDKFELVANKTLKVFLILLAPLVVGGLILADSLVALVGGEGFAASAAVLRVLIFALVFIFLGNLFNAILIVGNQQARLMRALAFVAVMNISANLFFIERYAYMAAAWISVATEFLVVCIGLFLILRHIRYRPRVEHGFRIVAAALIMGAGLFLIKEWNIALVLPIGMAMYGAALWLTQAIRQSELKTLIARDTEVAAHEEFQVEP